ncbi:CENTROMERE PROTEIN E, partial [Salix purpurea]
MTLPSCTGIHSVKAPHFHQLILLTEYFEVTTLQGKCTRKEPRKLPSQLSAVLTYGQTSSGKTYTMMGITEYTVADIFDYIHRHEERAFVLKFSAIEIYNEAIRDLLSMDSTPLRLLDDPEKGTV